MLANPDEGQLNTKAEKKPALFEVIDSSTNSNNRARTHEIVLDDEVKQIHFKYGEKTMLPFAEAMKFQKEGFEVRDAGGITINRAPTMTLSNVIELGHDKVIAHLSELTPEALYARAVALPGGERFKPNSSKDKIIRFLSDQAKRKIAVSGEKEKGSDELNDDELDKLGVIDD